MFQNKEIEIITYIAATPTDDYGMENEGVESVVDSLYVDVQPISKDLAFKIFGYVDDVSYRIFSDVNENLNTGTIIKYDDNYYKIVKLIVWDNYYDMLVDAYG